MKPNLLSIVGLMLLGCSSTTAYEYRTSSHLDYSDPQIRTPATPEVPRKTVEAMQDCVDRHASRLSSDSVALMYEIDAIGSVIVKDSMVPGSRLEACLTQTLEDMVVHSIAFDTQYVSGQSRGILGIVQAAAPIALLPIVLVAGGVTILVGITIYVGAEVIDAAKRRRPKGGNRCLDAAAAGGEMWRQLCRGVIDPAVRAGCWGLAERTSEVEKRNWCNAHEGFW